MPMRVAQGSRPNMSFAKLICACGDCVGGVLQQWEYPYNIFRNGYQVGVNHEGEPDSDVYVSLHEKGNGKHKFKYGLSIYFDTL